jgi:hypothetical protein
MTLRRLLRKGKRVAVIIISGLNCKEQKKLVKTMNKKQVVYWLSVALQVHSEPEIVERVQNSHERTN